MRGEWCYFKEYFTPEMCANILELGLKLPAEDAKIGVNGNLEVNETRKSKIRFIQKTDPNFAFLFDTMWKLAIQANDDFFRFNVTRISYIQLAEYDESYQGEYKRHHDVFWMNNDPDYHRKLTAVVQLTDPSTYEGGNFEMFNITQYPDASEIRSQGTAFFLPSFIEHQANPVTKGTRYSLACWFDGPKWS
jgi:PKHD-type hydroxylase